MRLLTCDELCDLLSDSERSIKYTVCRYSKRDQRFLGAGGNFGVVRWVKGSNGRNGDHLGYFDSLNDCRYFLLSLLEVRHG